MASINVRLTLMMAATIKMMVKIGIPMLAAYDRCALGQVMTEEERMTILENSAKNTEVTTNSKRLVATDPDGRCPTSSGECMSIFSLLDTIC